MSDGTMAYPKVANLGSLGTERVFMGPVTIQEKVDGSQFRIGTDGEGGFHVASHHQKLYEGNVAGMFQLPFEYAQDVIRPKLCEAWPENCWLFCEVVSKCKQNAITYDRPAKNGLVLFDVFSSGVFMVSKHVQMLAQKLCIDSVPTYHEGESTKDEALAFLGRESFLGGALAEGIVIKNYAETRMVGPHVWPVFTKFVRPEFRELNSKEHPAQKDKLAELFGQFCTEARWQKAIQHLREQGQIQDAVQDIGPLIKEITRDIWEEEGEAIAQLLLAHFRKDITRTATRGFPEWYKAQLLERI